MISYGNLVDGSITLFDIYKMNETLDYKNKYEELLRKEIEKEHRK